MCPTRDSNLLILLPMATALFSALDNALLSTSLDFTRIANATLLNNMAPLWVAIFAITVWKEKMTAGFWVGWCWRSPGRPRCWEPIFLGRPEPPRAISWRSISSVFYAGYFLVTQVARTRLTTIIYIFMVDLFAFGFLFLINLGMGNSFGPYPPLNLGVFLLAGLISQVGGYFGISYALGHLPASVVSPTLLLQPVITALLAIPLFGETLECRADRRRAGSFGGNLSFERFADQIRRGGSGKAAAG